VSFTQNSQEEWPSDVWNFQDNFARPAVIEQVGQDESVPISSALVPIKSDDKTALTHLSLMSFFTGIKGIGEKMAHEIIQTLGIKGVVEALTHQPEKLCEVKNVKAKKLALITSHWQQFSQTL
jgi:ERCC4-type nuclease